MIARWPAIAVSTQSTTDGTTPICSNACGSERQPAPSVAVQRLKTDPHSEPSSNEQRAGLSSGSGDTRVTVAFIVLVVNSGSGLDSVEVRLRATRWSNERLTPSQPADMENGRHSCEDGEAGRQAPSRLTERAPKTTSGYTVNLAKVRVFGPCGSCQL